MKDNNLKIMVEKLRLELMIEIVQHKIVWRGGEWIHFCTEKMEN